MLNSNVSRRDFISKSLGGLAAAGLATISPGFARADDGPDQKKTGSGELIYRTLGRTGIKLPIVGMGVMNSNNPEIVQASYEHGVRLFATAANYQLGRNEQMVGQVIKRLGVRDKVVIATNILIPEQRANLTPAQTREKTLGLFEGSLRRLKTDYVDILNIHSVSSVEEVRNDGAKEALALLKKQGKARAVGVTTHQAMGDVINEVAEEGFFDVVTTSINVSMADDTALLSAIDNAASKGMGIIAMKTQAGGRQLPNQDSLGQYPSAVVNTASLKWVLHNKSISTAIPGYNNVEHMREDFSVAGNLDYTEEERKFLSENNLTLSMGFCRQCRECLPGCPYNVDVPALMRTHMYAAQYANFHQARATLDDIPRANGLGSCTNCPTCAVRCAHFVDVAYRIGELKLMYT